MTYFKITYIKESQQLRFLIQNTLSSDQLLEHFFLSRKQRYIYYQQHRIQQNQNWITKNTQLHPQDEVRIDVSPFEITSIPSWHQEVKVCYEDDLFLIVDKPAGIIIHSDGVNTSHTLNNCIQAYYEEHHIQAPVRPIHRLDQETSGLVLYCKIPFLQPLLDHLLHEKKIERIYLAWVKGTIQEKKIIIDQPLARDRHQAKKMRVSAHGMDASTTVLPKKRNKNTTLVECHLKTGRTHQIRVHLAYLHHSILSDPLYGTKDSRINRCALHAWKIRIAHPLSGEMIEVISDLPNDMNHL